MSCLARLIRLVMVPSGTRNARAISAVVRPPTARSVRAICDAGDSDGWQHRNSRISESSRSGSAPSVAQDRSAAGASHSSGSDPGGDRVLALPTRLLAAQQVGQPAGGDGDQPARAGCRRAVLRPLGRGGEQRLLHSVLRGIEMPVPADQRAEDLRRKLAQQVLDVAIGPHDRVRRGPREWAGRRRTESSSPLDRAGTSPAGRRFPLPGRSSRTRRWCNRRAPPESRRRDRR